MLGFFDLARPKAPLHRSLESATIAAPHPWTPIDPIKLLRASSVRYPTGMIRIVLKANQEMALGGIDTSTTQL